MARSRTAYCPGVQTPATPNTDTTVSVSTACISLGAPGGSKQPADGRQVARPRHHIHIRRAYTRLRCQAHPFQQLRTAWQFPAVRLPSRRTACRAEGCESQPTGHCTRHGGRAQMALRRTTEPRRRQGREIKSVQRGLPHSRLCASVERAASAAAASRSGRAAVGLRAPQRPRSRAPNGV